MKKLAGKIRCSVCRKEIPESAKEMPEVAEYARHFCSHECQHVSDNADKEYENLGEMVANPERYFDSPSDVLEDYKISDEKKLKILQSWGNDALELQKADEENMDNGNRSRLSEVHKAILKLKNN